jgi:hypothetical protein
LVEEVVELLSETEVMVDSLVEEGEVVQELIMEPTLALAAMAEMA